MDVVCCDIRVVSSRKRRGERVGVGSGGKYPGAPPHHKGKRNQADRKRYLIGLLGEKGKAKKKKQQTIQDIVFGDPQHHYWQMQGQICILSSVMEAGSLTMLQRDMLKHQFKIRK
jgi:hypothetical protein